MKNFFIPFIVAVLFFLAAMFVLKQIERRTSNEKFIELRYEDNESLTYYEAISAYKALDKQHDEAKLLTYGKTDSGKPLNLFVISKTGNFSPENLRARGFRVVMVNNGIHPGEPCGIDASVKLARDVLGQKENLWELMDSTVLCIVPIYNVGGSLDQSPYNRANQNGPKTQGFRANARYLDLNRDFAPMDSKNAQSFAQMFHHWKPNLLIDTHTTNGADYQYVMTLIPNHWLELPPMLGNYYDKVMEPYLYKKMEMSGYDMIPYVSPMGQTPESGLEQWVNSPRYTTGYGRMFNTITLMTESHMFKPFRDRVLATYEFVKAALEFTHENGATLKSLKDEADNFTKNQKEFVLHWERDSSKFEMLPFKGYEAELIKSEVTGDERLRYRRDMPFVKEVPYYRHYNPSLTITKPDYYIVPQAWHEVVHRLTINGVDMKPLANDTIMEVVAYYIENYKTRMQPYNGRYLHYDIEVRKETQNVQFFKGDFIIHTNQLVNEFIVEMLEPQAYDSYFTWGFFNSVLQRKEYFSPYVFDDYAKQMLDQDADLKNEFERKKQLDKEFASNTYAQLNFFYERSPFFHKGFRRYPIYRSVMSNNN